MKKNLYLLFAFLQINFAFAQKDTLKLLVQKGTKSNIEIVESSPYHFLMSAGGICGNPVMVYIDTSSIKTSKDSLKAENFAKTYFAEGQKDYFNMIYKKFQTSTGLILVVKR